MHSVKPVLPLPSRLRRTRALSRMTWPVAWLLLWLAGTSTLPAIAQRPDIPLVNDPSITPTTKILPGTLLTITVTDEPQLTGAFPVDADGNIHFTLTDEDGGNKQEWSVSVKDKTADEA